MKRFLKRIFDIMLSAVLLVLLSPVLLILYLLVLTKLGHPALFKQKRPGQGGRVFELYKFRSMTNERGKHGQLLSDEDRLTNFGKLLRRTSLDELPELINILKGDMSFVGPRPLLIKYLNRYTKEQARRHEVKPGLTGWAQVNGRNGISWEEKFKLDVWYVDHWTLWLDMKILLMTLTVVFKASGISAAGEATASEFMGETEDNE